MLAFVPVLAILAIFPRETHPADRPRSTGSTGRTGGPGGAWQAARQLGTLLQRCLGKAPEDVVCHTGHGPEEEDSRDHGAAQADLFSEISTGAGSPHGFAAVLLQIAVTQQSTEPVLPRQRPSEGALQSSLLGSFVFINVLPRFACITSFLQQL